MPQHLLHLVMLVLLFLISHSLMSVFVVQSEEERDYAAHTL